MRDVGRFKRRRPSLLYDGVYGLREWYGSAADDVRCAEGVEEIAMYALIC